MSSISSTHAITAFISGVSVPLDGNTLVVSRGNSKSDTKSICASVPPITPNEIFEYWESLAPFVSDMIEDARGKVLRSLHSGGAIEITSEAISLTAVLSYLDSVSESSRITREQITSFLEEKEQKETLRAAFALQLKYSDSLTSEQSKKLDKMHRAISDTISELAGARTYWEEKKRNGVSRYLSLLDESSLKSRLLSRVEGMVEKQDNTLAELGF